MPQGVPSGKIGKMSVRPSKGSKGPPMKTGQSMPWNFYMIAAPTDTLADAFERFYMGDEGDRASKASYFAKRPWVPQLQADKETTRQQFLKSFGIDPFEGKGTLSQPIEIMVRDATGKMVPTTKKASELTIDEAKRYWFRKRREKKAQGYIKIPHLGAERWVKDTPENRLKQYRGRMAVSRAALQEYSHWVPMKSAKAIFQNPAFQRKLEEFAAKSKGMLPGIPLQMLRGLLADNARNKIEQQYWFKTMDPWPKIEAKMKKMGATRKAIRDAQKKYMEGYNRVVTPKLSRVPAMVAQNLSKKGVTIKQFVSFGNKFFKGLDPVRVEVGSPQFDRMMKAMGEGDSGWFITEKSRKGLQKALAGITDPADPSLKVFKVHATDPDLDKERKWLARARKLGIDRRWVRDAVKWAADNGYLGYAERLEASFGREASLVTIMRMYEDHANALATPYVKGQYRPAHGLGRHGFAAWHKAEGFSGPQGNEGFKAHIIKVLDVRKAKLKDALKKKLLTVQEAADYEKAIEGIESAQKLYAARKKDIANVAIGKKDKPPFGEWYSSPIGPAGKKGQHKFRVKPWTRNSYGMLVRTDPDAYLYAAYFNLFRKDKGGRWSPSHEKFAGLTSANPQYVRYGDVSVTPWVDKYAHIKPTAAVDVKKEVETIVPQTWGEALTGGARSFEEMLRARMLAFRTVTDLVAEGKNLSDFRKMVKGGDEIAEQILMFPARFLAMGGGALEGLLGGIGWRLGAADMGVDVESLRSLRRMTPSELRSYALHLSKKGVNPKYLRYKGGQLFVEATNRDIALAKDTEKRYRELIDKGFWDAAGINFNEMVVGIVGLPEIVLGKSLSDHRKMGKTGWDRYLKTMQEGRGIGYDMGTGSVDFMWRLGSRPTDTIRAAPVDTLLTVLPWLRSAIKLAKAGKSKFSSVEIEKIKKLYNAARKIDAHIKSKTGVSISSIYAKTAKASGSALLSMEKKWSALREAARQGKSAFLTAISSSLALRELNARALVSKVHRGLLLGDDLRDMANEIRDAARKSKDPRAFREYLSALKSTLGEDIIARTELKHVFAEAETLYKAMEKDGVPISAKDYRARGAVGTTPWYKSKAAADEAYAKVVKAAEKGADDLAKTLKDVALPRAAGRDAVSDLLGPDRVRYVGQDVGVKVNVQHAHSDWYSRHIMLNALMGKRTKKGIVYANPEDTARRLKALRKAIAEGDEILVSDPVAWLFGGKVDLSIDKKSLGGARLWHGDATGKKAITADSLKKTIDDALKSPASRKKVLSALDDQIKRLGDLEALTPQARNALGLKPRKKVKGGWVDEEWPVLGTALDDGARKQNLRYLDESGLDDAGPNIFVPKGTSSKILEAKVDKKIESVLDDQHIKKGLLQSIVGINKKLQDQGKPGIKPPKGKRWLDATESDMRNALINYTLQTDALPTGADKLVKRLFDVKSDAYVKMLNMQKDIDAGIGAANATVQKFKQTLKDQGPVAAFNEMFGVAPDAPLSLRAISNAPGAAAILKTLDSAETQNVISAVRQRMILDAVGPKKAVMSFSDNVAQKLEAIADDVEGKRVRSWWETQGGSSKDLDSKNIKKGNTPFVVDIVNGNSSPDLPPVLTKNPQSLIMELNQSKDALWALAEKKGVSKRNFELSFSNAIQRLRRFVEVKQDFKRKLGVGETEVAYIPHDVNTALKWQARAKVRLGPVISFVKRNLTSRNPVTFMNNLLSSMALQFARTGRIVNPFKYRKLITLMRKERSLDRAIAGRATADRIALQGKMGISDADMDMMQRIRNVPGFLERGFFERELGGARGYSKWNPMKKLEEAYRYTDQGFKFDEAIRGYKFLDDQYHKIPVGETFKIEINEGVFMTLKKTSKGADIITPTGRVKGSLNPGQLKDKFAEASSVSADRAFVNYDNLPKLLAFMRSNPGFQALGMAAPMLTWAYKALWLPGVKRGVAAEVFRPTPYFYTSDLKTSARLFARSVGVSARMHIATQMGRDRLAGMRSEDLNLILSYLPHQMRARLVSDLTEAGFLRSKDLGWMTPFGPTQTLFKVIRYGQWHLIEKGDLYGDDNAPFASHWLGPKTSGTGKERKLMFNLLNEVGEKSGYSANGKLTKKGKELLRLRKYILGEVKKGSTYGFADLQKLTLLTGAPLRDLVNTLQKAGEAGANPNSIYRGLANYGLTLFLGGAVARSADIAVGLTDRDSIFTSRSKVPLTPRGESGMRFAIRRLTGIGYNIKDVAKNKKRILGQVTNNLKRAFLGSKEDKNSLLGGYEALIKAGKGGTDQAMMLSRKIDRITRIVKSEVQLLDYNLTTGLNFRAAALKRRRTGRRPGVGKKIRFSKTTLVRDGDKWKFVEVKDLPQIQQLFKMQSHPGLQAIDPMEPKEKVIKVIDTGKLKPGSKKLMKKQGK